GEVQTSAPTAQYYTLFVMLVWLAVAGISQFPVPVIGAGMWWVGLVAIIAVSEERFNQLWWVKTGVLLYAVLVVLLRLGLLALQMTSPAAWSSVMGGSAEAQIALASTRNSVGMIGMLIIFVMYPVGYAGMLFNRYLRNPKPLYNMFTEAGDVIRNLRTRQRE
ncbi:MAG: hypothetical protein C0411_24515, partial [Pseudomonas sp.]|nr:hypothetical protein [Pseudomonas sp.]